MVGKRASKSKKIEGIVTKTGVTVKEAYCRKCMKIKPPNQFSQSFDNFLDGNGLLSICKSCLEEMYTSFYANERNMDRVILRMCRMLNIRFSSDVVATTRKHLETSRTNNHVIKNIFGLYISKFKISQGNSADYSEENTYQDVSIGETVTIAPDDNEFVQKDLKQFWGENFNHEDYDWLESEMWEWKKTHKIDTRSEEHLLRLIVLKLFDIRKARFEGKDTGSLEKSLQEMLKTANLAPNQANAASGGKSMDTFGLWIKEIEEKTPAEWVKDNSIWKDVDNIEEYAEKFITSPLRSFITGQRDFFLEDEDETVASEEYEDEEEQ